VHDDRVDAGLLEKRDVAGESLAELRVAHCVTAIFHHDGLVLVALHVGQGLNEKAGLVFAFGLGHGGLSGMGGRLFNACFVTME